MLEFSSANCSLSIFAYLFFIIFIIRFWLFGVNLFEFYCAYLKRIYSYSSMCNNTDSVQTACMNRLIHELWEEAEFRSDAGYNTEKPSKRIFK